MTPDSSPDPSIEVRLPTRLSKPEPLRRSPRRILRYLLAGLVSLLLLCALAVIAARWWLHRVTTENLPQLSGFLITPGLTAPVTITRDPHGIPTLHARTFDDLLFAQGFVTAQDRLFQMDTLRRHAAGELAEILGSSLIPHDRLQRTLALGPAADRILTQLPPDQLHAFKRYAAGVNAAIAVQRDHLPLEFRLLAYQPRPWTPRDCVLVSLILFEDLTNTFPSKLSREALTARLAPTAIPDQRAELLADLYPVGSWRDHPPSQPATDLTTPLETFPEIPLDNSQVQLHLPSPPAPLGSTLSTERHIPQKAVISTDGEAEVERPPYFFHTRDQAVDVSPSTAITARVPHPSQPHRNPGSPPASLVGWDGWDVNPPTATPSDLLTLSALTAPVCPDCRAGSNNFTVSGAHTASGSPLLANDMHLSLTAPGIWYAVNLRSDAGPAAAAPFHAAGVSLPGVPYIVVGHNDHVAWGFTNLGADVQDLYIEHLRGPVPTAESHTSLISPVTKTATQFRDETGTWQGLQYRSETIRVRGGRNIVLDLQSTQHGNVDTPLLNPILPSERRAIALRWSLYDTDRFSLPFANFNAAASAADLVAAAATYTGPAQNLLAADDAGHIAFHAIGRVPLRGPILLPSPLSPVPTDTAAPDAATHEWSSTIPFDQLPAVIDPPAGLLATANARVTPDAYPFPITLNWADPYRNERIWRLLANRSGLTPQDMLHIQTDVFSDSDHLIAQRLAYAIDRSPKATKHLRAAADLLRAWDGNVTATSAAAAITTAAREALWPMLLTPQLAPGTADLAHLYTWGERNFALEQLLAHTPARWLPSTFATWDDLLTAAVDQGLHDAHAPSNLAGWSSGQANPVEIQLPLFAQLPLLGRLAGLPTGSGTHPQSGNGLTIRQSRRTFGPSERFIADLASPDADTLVLPLGESGNPLSPWFRDQFPAWLDTSTYPLPFTAITGSQTLTLTPN